MLATFYNSYLTGDRKGMFQKHTSYFNVFMAWYLVKQADTFSPLYFRD